MGAGPSTNLNAAIGGQTTGYTCSVDNSGNISCRRLSQPVAGGMLYTCSNSGSGQYPIVCSDGSATTYACTGGPNPTCVVERDLLAPTISVRPASSGGYTISWTSQAAPYGATYAIYRSDKSRAISNGTISASQAMSYTDNTAAPGRSYQYWVEVSNGADMVKSNIVTVGASGGSPSDSSNTLNLTIQPSGLQNVTISWNALPGSGTYTVTRTTMGTADPPAVISRTSGTSATDTSARPAQPYIYTVSYSGTSPPTVGSASYAVLGVPSGGQSMILQGAYQNGAPYLWWTAPFPGGTYSVYRATKNSAAAPATLASGISGSNISDNSAQPGQTYFYGVVHSSGAGDVTTISVPGGGNGGVLTPPLVVQPPQLSGNALLLTWNDVGAGKYTIVRSASGESPKTFTTTGLSYRDSGINPNKAYTYTVTGSNGGQSISGVASYTPAATTTLTLTAQTTTGVTTLSWNNVGGSQYLVSRSPTGQNQYAQLGSTAQTFFHDRSAQAGSTYDYQVTTTVNGAPLQGTLTYTVPTTPAPITPPSNTWWWVGGGLLLLLIIIVIIVILVVLARRKPEGEPVEVEFEEV